VVRKRAKPIRVLAPQSQPANAHSDDQLVPYATIRASQLTRTRPPTQYIYCSEGQQLDLQPEHRVDGLPSVVALLIPSQFLNASIAPPQSLVEVRCSVMDIMSYPLTTSTTTAATAAAAAAAASADQLHLLRA